MDIQEKLWETCEKIYKQMYKEADPSADFDALRKTGEVKNPNFFMAYFLDNERQQKIIDRICKEDKVNRIAIGGERTINQEVHLGCSPNTCRRTWKEHRAKNVK